MSEISLKVKNIFAIVIILCLVFQDILENNIKIFQYFDECITVFLIIYLLIYIFLKRKINKIYLNSLFIVICIILIGLISNYYFKIQTNIIPILMDIGNIFKFIFVFLGGILFFENIKNKNKIFNTLSRVVGVIIIIAFIFGMINIFLNINMHTDIRFGLRSYNFIFSRVGDLYMACFNILIILTADLCYNDIRKSRFLYIFLTLIVMCLTLRSRAFIFAAVYIVLYWFFIKKKQDKIKWSYILFSGIIAFIIGYPQIEFYFLQGGGTQARSILLEYGIDTAIRYFPLGSGFSTYGTYASKVYYSPLYYEYGFHQIYGLGLVHSDFINDNYWPAIIAQFGFITSLLMIKVIYNLYIIMKRRIKNNYSRFILIYSMGILSIASLVTSSFLTCVNTMLILSLIFSEDKSIRKVKGNIMERNKD